MREMSQIALPGRGRPEPEPVHMQSLDLAAANGATVVQAQKNGATLVTEVISDDQRTQELAEKRATEEACARKDEEINALHEVIATENHEMLKFVLEWNGSAPVDVNARTGRGVDIFELARSVGPGIAMNMFGIFRNVKSKTFVSVPTFRKKMFILGALETFVRRTYLYNALRTWRDNT